MAGIGGGMKVNRKEQGDESERLEVDNHGQGQTCRKVSFVIVY